MYNPLCFSVYISSFEKQKTMLESAANSGAFVFSSFHTAEENTDDYIPNTARMCHWLKERGFRIIGDVSCRTAKTYHCKDILDFARIFEIDVLRLDYGFTPEETLEIAKKIPIALNASCIEISLAKKVQQIGKKVYAMHNFYPRPETGLSEHFFRERNRQLKQLGIEPFAFIPCDERKRAPIFEGLPTLEYHRKLPPYCSYIDLAKNYGIQHIFAADTCMSSAQLFLINEYIETGMICVPVVFDSAYEGEYDTIYTLRIDSPSCAFRLAESREYSHPGNTILPDNCVERFAGAITMDNCNYKRYSGEMMIIRTPLPEDERVNVIGYVKEEYRSLLFFMNNGAKIKLIRAAPSTDSLHIK